MARASNGDLAGCPANDRHIINQPDRVLHCANVRTNAQFERSGRCGVRMKKPPVSGRLRGVSGARPACRPLDSGLRLFAQRRLLVLDGVVLMFLDALLVAHDLPIEPVDHEIDSGVQIAVGAFDEDVFAL